MVEIRSVIGGILTFVLESGRGAGGSKAEPYFIGQGTIQKKCEEEVLDPYY